MAEQKNKGHKIIFFDPNDINGEYLTNNPEDLAISVELLVIPTEDRIVDDRGDYFRITWRPTKEDPNKVVNFFQGKKIGNMNVFTDFYSDVSYNSSKNGDVKEALGIKSIDIEYNTWYMPQVTIKFIDVRGLSLLNPSQYAHDRKDQVAGSFFSALLSFPYPLFKIQIKGYYGDAVTYDLQCYHTDITISAETGNVEITAKFVGYTFSFLADIQFNMIKSAPFNNYGGKKYWYEQVANGRFMLDDGSTPIPNFVDFRNDIEATVADLNKLSDTEGFIKYSYATTGREYIKNVTTFFNAYIIEVNKVSILFSVEGGDNRTEKMIKFLDLSDTDLQEKIKKNPDYERALNDFKNAINDYNASDSGKNVKLIEFPGGGYSANNFEIKHLGVFENEKKVYSLDYSGFLKSIEEADVLLKNIVIDSNMMLQTRINNTVTQNIKFKPTIGNILKIIFAHFETFFYSYTSCLNQINEIDVERRKKALSKIITGNKIKERTLLNTDTGKVDLPPFFDIFKDDDKNSETWIGSNHIAVENKEDFAEIKYISEYTKSLTAYENRITELSTKDAIYKNDNFWLPISPFDISAEIIKYGIHLSNPYNALISSDSSADYYNLVTQIGIRMFYGLSTYDRKISDSTITAIAKAEANNIFSALGDNESMMRNFREDDVQKEMYVLMNGEDYQNKGRRLWGINIEGKGRPSSVFYVSNHNKLNYYNFIIDKRRMGVLPLYSALVNEYNTNEELKITCKNEFCNNPNVPLLFEYERDSTNKNTINAFFSIQEYNKEVENLKADVSTKPDIGETLVKEWKIDVDDSLSFFSVSNIFDTIKNSVEGYSIFSGFYNGFLSRLTGGRIPMITDENRVDDSLSIPNGEFFNHAISLNTQKLNVTLKELRESGYSSYMLPNIGFKYNTNTTVSLFGSKIYYTQNDKKIIGKNPDGTDKFLTEDDENERRMCAKASLFLNCLGVDLNKLNNLFNTINAPSMRRIPRTAILLLGAQLWRFKFTKGNNGVDPIIDCSKNNYFRLENILCSDGKKVRNVFSNIFTNSHEFKLRERVVDVIINYFKDWAINEYIFFEENFELKEIQKTKEYNFQSFSFDRVYREFGTGNSITIKQIRDTFGDKVFDKYSFIFKTNDIPDNNKIGSFFNLFNKPNSDGVSLLMELYKEDVLMVNTSSDIFEFKDNKTRIPVLSFALSTSVIEKYLTTLSSELKELLGFTTNSDEKPNNETKLSDIPNNEIANIEKYKTFREFYRRWSFILKSHNNFKMETYLGKNGCIKVIDKFYRDISDEYIVNLENIGNLIRTLESSSESTFISFLSKLFSDNQMMFIPTPNNVDFIDEKGLEKMFKPISYREKKAVIQTPGYTAVYAGKPSEISGGGNSRLSSDTLNIYRQGGRTICDAPAANDKMSYRLPCFAVSYGKQNQSYFKIGKLTNTNPTITEQSIIAQQDIARTSVDGGIQRQNMGQNLYSIYSSNAYTADIEMMGCAQIQPLMYFQLFNVYLFTGAYMIYKVTHSIVAGRMTTKFTGIKQNKYYPHMTDQAFSFQEVLIDPNSDIGKYMKNFHNDNNTYISTQETYKGGINEKYRRTGGIYGPAPIAIVDGSYIDEEYMDMQIGNTKYKMYDMITTQSNKGSIRTIARRQMPEEVYYNLLNFIPYLNSIDKWIKETWGDNYYLYLHSVWRHRINGYFNSFHGYGKAADFTVRKKNGTMDGIEFVEKNDILYDYLRTKFPDRNMITELLKEGTNGEFTTNHKGWIHLSILGWDYPNKPIVCSAIGNSGSCIDGKRYAIT